MNWKRDLRRVRWIGGSACAGKSVLTARLAAEHGLRPYHCDQRFDDHRRRADPARHPHFCRVASRSPEELWTPPAAERARELRGFYEEEFEMAVEDLRPLAAQGPVLAEGAGLLPALVAAIVPEPGRALWLVATPEFRRRHYPRRGPLVRRLLGRCRDPERAFRGWMERDDGFAAWVAAEARRLGMRVLAVDGRLSLGETAAEAARHLGLAPPQPSA